MFIFDKSFFDKVGAYFFPEKGSEFKWKESGSIDTKLCLFHVLEHGMGSRLIFLTL